MTNTPLKPCPFCGGNPTLVSENAFEDGTVWQIYCSNDDCPVQPATTGSFFQDETLSDWNTRAAAPMTEAEMEMELEVILQQYHGDANKNFKAAIRALAKKYRGYR